MSLRFESSKRHGQCLIITELRHPEFHKAVETGAIERYRTGAMTLGDASLIDTLSWHMAKWPNGVETSLFNGPPLGWDQVKE